MMKSTHETSNPPRWTRAIAWFTNPHGLNNDKKLRKAVSGKVVLITGASFGIGEATAQRMAAMGAIVVLVARSADKLEQVATAIRATGGKAFTYTTDLSKPDEAKKLAEDVLRDHGHVDVLINNAGRSIRRSISLSVDRFHDFERTMAINYLGPVQLVLSLLPSMQARKQGHIVNISTWGVRMPPGARWAAYQASKGAFDTWLRSVALEIKADGITTTSIYPAIVYTRMSAPTPGMHSLPGMTTDDAAHVIELAVVEKPFEITPPWLHSWQIASVILPTPMRKSMEWVFKLTKDSEASVQGIK